MFGPREVLLTSDEPVVKQFLNGRKEGPIGMSEEKDAGQVAAELAAMSDEEPAPGTGPKGATGGGVPPQLQPSEGLPERKAAARRQQRVLEMLHTLPAPAQAAIRKSLPDSASGWSSGPGLSASPDGASPEPANRQPSAAERDGEPVGADRTPELGRSGE